MRLGRAFGPLVLVGGFGISAACHSSSSGGSAASGPVARFKLGDGAAAPAYLDVPFPSDAYLDATSGKIVDPLPGADAIIPNGSSFITHGLAQEDGFSRVALANFVVDDPTGEKLADGNSYAKIDVASLPVAEADCVTATSAVYLVDLAPSDPSKAILPCRAGFHDDTPRSSTPPVISVGPARGLILDEGHEYAAVLTSRAKDAKGRGLGASDEMRAVAAGTAPGAMGAIYNKAYAAAAAALKPMLADGASIVAIAPYKTMAMSHELFAMRDALEGAPMPALTWDDATMAPMGAKRFAAPVNGKLPAGFTASLDDLLGVAPTTPEDFSGDAPVHAHAHLAAIGTGVFQAINYLPEKAGLYPDPAHHVFVYDASGVPTPQQPVKIWVTFAVPSTPAPASGYPTVILQHGLSGSRLFLASMADALAKNGWMVAAIDSVTFGARAAESMYQVDKISAWAGAPGAKYDGPDGFADPVDQGGNPTRNGGATNGSFDFFGGLQNILAARDQFRQAGFDTAQLVRLLRSGPDLSALDVGAGAPKIDPDRIAYIGDSLGAMEGTIAAAIEPHVKAWMLNVDGGSLGPDLVSHSPTIGLQIAAAAALNFDLSGDHLDQTHPFIQLLQDILEPGDPITYAPYLVKAPRAVTGLAAPRNVLQVQAIYDEIVPNEANEAIARAGGWGIATPNVGSNAEVWDVKSATSNPRKTPLPDVSPDATGAIHDTPAAGFTAVLVQCSPCAHGNDMYSRHGGRDFLIPYFDATGHPNYQRQSPAVTVAEPFDGIQAAMTTFLGDAFAGSVPRVMGFTPPVRDFDGDGTADDADPDPNDPTVK